MIYKHRELQLLTLRSPPTVLGILDQRSDGTYIEQPSSGLGVVPQTIMAFSVIAAWGPCSPTGRTDGAAPNGDLRRHPDRPDLR
jgi:hypothetical protein